MTNGAKSFVNVVLDSHAENAAFVWLLRKGATSEPHYLLKSLAKLDSRIDAHIDGLRVAAEPGWAICEEALSWKEPGELFAAGVLALESGDQKKIDKVLQAAVAAPDAAVGVISAIGWLPFDRIKSVVAKLTASADAILKRIGIGGSAIHRQFPGPALAEAVTNPDPVLKARAIKAIGELGRLELVIPAKSHLNSPDPAVRFWAAWTCVILSDVPAAVAALQEIALSGSSFRERAARMAVRRGDGAAWVKKLQANPKHKRIAALAAGAIGNPANIPWLIDQMKDLPLSRVAGEAFTMITGADLALLDLERKPPEDFESGPNDDPADENVDLDPDDWLPWPDPDLVRKWWAKNAARFPANMRHLVGKPMDILNLQRILIEGKQRQRAAAATELAIRQPGKPLFEVRMPGFRQIAILGK